MTTQPDPTTPPGPATPPGPTPPDPEPTAAEEGLRKMREALDRKRGASHPDDAAGGRGGVRGRSSGTTRREFRRKSG